MHGGSALQLQARRFLRPLLLLLLLRCWGSCCSGNGGDRFDSSGWTAVAAPTSSCFARIPALRPPPPPPRAQQGRSSCAREAAAAALWRPLLAAARNCSCASPPALKPPRPPFSLQDLGVPWKGGGEGCTLVRTHTYSHSHSPHTQTQSAGRDTCSAPPRAGSDGRRASLHIWRRRICQGAKLQLRSTPAPPSGFGKGEEGEKRIEKGAYTHKVGILAMPLPGLGMMEGGLLCTSGEGSCAWKERNIWVGSC